MEKNTTKKCPHCQADIPANAKKCSQCQTDLRNWLNRHPLLTIVLVIVLVPIVISSISNNNLIGSNSSGNTQDTQPTLVVVNIDTKVTEKNSVWWKYSWILTLKNTGTRDRVVNAELSWQDKDKFVLDTDRQYGLSIPAGTEKTFSGYQLVDIQTAPSVYGIGVNIK